MVKETENKPKKRGNPNPKQLPPGPGRPKGVPNKITGIAKDNIASVFEMIGGIENMAEWAKKNTTEFYKHYAKLIPVQITGDDENPLNHKVTVEFVTTKNTDS